MKTNNAKHSHSNFADDFEIYKRLTTIDLEESAYQKAATPGYCFEHQTNVLATHWHPEFFPLWVAKQRIQHLYPNCENQLVIPTDHNQLKTYGSYAGVEVDCYSPEFNRKIQLLLHFNARRIEGASVLKAMLQHTYGFRERFFEQFLDTILLPTSAFLVEKAIKNCGASQHTAMLVKEETARFRQIFKEEYASTPEQAITNSLLVNFFKNLTIRYEKHEIEKAIVLIMAIKKQVYANIDLSFFYTTNQIIEETRGLGGCIVVPHPEQFWTVLLADYDIDGVEIWNPSSHEYSRFLAQVLRRKNEQPAYSHRSLLTFMGDDTHFSKLYEQIQQDEKPHRELGFQPAWDDISIKKELIKGGISKAHTIAAYRERLG